MSTLRVSNLQNESSSNNQIVLGTDGFATVNGVAMPTAGPLSNRNLIINGAMQVAQRGTSSTTNGYGTVDRYKASYSGGTVTQTQTAITSGDPYDEGFRYVLRLTNTTANTGASANRVITQKIEAQNIANSGWNYTSSTSYVTLSFWVRASVAQTYYVNLKTSDGTSQNYSTSFALSADTWTKVTKKIPGSSNVAFDNNNEQGLQVHFVVFRGTDSTTSGHTLDTWAAYSGSDIVPDMTNTWANTTDATFDITGVQLEVGSVATPFEHRSYGDELARCQRYYQHFATDTANAVYLGMGIASGSTSARMFMPISVAMRTTPSITENGASADDQIDSTYALSSPSVIGSTASTVRVQFTTSGMTGGRPLQLQVGTGESITLSAEL